MFRLVALTANAYKAWEGSLQHLRPRHLDEAGVVLDTPARTGRSHHAPSTSCRCLYAVWRERDDHRGEGSGSDSGLNGQFSAYCRQLLPDTK